MFHRRTDDVNFEVVTPATDLTLLTAEQLRIAAGLSDDDDSKDITLTPLGLQIASEIATAAKVASAGGNPITLRSETCRATFYLHRHRENLVLPRRFVSSVTSVVENGMTLAETDYIVKGEAGMLRRLHSDCPSWWCSGKTVVDFVCGFATIEDDLRGGAMDLIQVRLSETSRDPLIKSISTNVPELEDRKVDYWVGGAPNSDGYGSLPDSVAKKLSRYVGVGVWG